MSKDAFNAAQREGAQTPVTRAGLDRLAAERDAAIAQGEARLKQASNDLRDDFASQKQDAARAAYIQAQQRLAERRRDRELDRGPSR